MGLTTVDYLRYLRSGDYPRAMRWIFYLRDKCKQGDAFNADALLPVSVFELIRSGFCMEDYKHIELLFAAQGDDPVFKDEAGYSCTNWCNAAMQFRVYSEYNLLQFYSTEESWAQEGSFDMDKVLEFMSCDYLTPKGGGGQSSGEVREDKLRDCYYALENVCPYYAKAVEKLREDINALTPLREQCSEYLNKLAVEASKASAVQDESVNIKDKIEEQHQFNVRMGIVYSLSNYLNLSMKSTIDWRIVSNWLTQIEQHPLLPWEADFISALQPPTISYFIYRTANNLLFFSKALIGSIIQMGEPYSVSEEPNRANHTPSCESKKFL